MKTEFVTFTYKITPKVSAQFGEIDNIHPTPHTGVDFVVSVNTPIYAPVDSIVSRVEEHHALLGKAVFLKTDSGYQIVLGHLNDIKVKIGEHVHSGELVALSGNSGNSTGPHLHLGIIDKLGQFIDPNVFFNSIKSMYFTIQSQAVVAFGKLDSAIDLFMQNPTMLIPV